MAYFAEILVAAEAQQIVYEIIVRDSGSSALDLFSLNLDKLTAAAVKGFSKLYDILIDSGKNFAIFEDTLSHARRTMDLNREDTLLLGDALMDLATNFDETGLRAGVSANELAKISGVLGQLGFSARDNTEQFTQLVAVVAKVGTAFGMSSAKAAEGLGILRNLYDLPVEKLENAASSIAYLGNTTVATAGQIMQFMQRVGGVAGLLGVTAQEAAALGATLRESGVTANLAGTSMSQIFSKMASDVDKFGEVLKKGGVSGAMLRMKIEAGDATDALKMVLQGLQNIQAREGKIAATQALKDLGLSGVRVQQTLLALSNNIAGLNKNLAASDKAFRENAAVDKAYQAAIDNTWQKWNQFKNIIDVIQKMIGKDLALAFSDFLEKHLIPFTTHFKDWLKTSEGAEAIFGRNGLIASGLDWIGTKLTENEGKIFDWLNNIDKRIPEVMQALKNELKEAIKPISFYLKETEEHFRQIWPIIDDIGKAWKSIKELTETIKEALTPLKLIYKAIWDASIGISTAMLKMVDYSAKLIEVFTKLGTLLFDKIAPAISTIADKIGPTLDWAYEGMKQGTQDVITKVDSLVDKINEVTEAGQEMGDVMQYHSVLPDVEAGIISVTEKTYDWRDSLGETITMGKRTGSSLENIYQTGHNTFSNLTRDMDGYHEAFKNSGWKANTDVQYYLTQTGEAVGQLGTTYAKTGEKVRHTTKKVKELAEVARQVQEMAIPSAQEIVRQKIPSDLFTNMSATQLSNFMGAASPTFFSSSGLIDLQNLLRQKQNEEWRQQIGLPTTTTPVSQAEREAMLQSAKDLSDAAKNLSDAANKQKEPQEITLQMGDEEVGRIYNKLADYGQQNQRRGLGKSTAGGF